MKTRNILSASGIVLAAIVLVAVNSVSRTTLQRATIDVTEDRLYTLSEGTKKIVGSISDPITFKYYFSKTDTAKYPGIKVFGSRVLEMLREFEGISGGKIKLEVYNPRPDSEEEEWAQKYGLDPLPLDESTRVFWGLVGVNSEGNEAVIPAFNFSRESFLEYDVTKLVLSLVTAKKPKIGILSSLPLKNPADSMNIPGMPTPPGGNETWVFLSQLEQNADVEMLQPSLTTLGSEYAFVLVLHPIGLPDTALYALDQYAVRGGKLLVAVDPYSQTAEMTPAGDPQDPNAKESVSPSSSLNALLKKWGVELEEGKVVGDGNFASRVQAGQGGKATDFPVWMTITPNDNHGGGLFGELEGRNPRISAAASINRTDVTTSALETLMFAWAGSLKITPTEGVQAVPLIATTAASKLYNVSDFMMGGGDPDAIAKNFMPDGEQRIVAVRLSGKLKSNYESKPSEVAKSAAAPSSESSSAGSEHITEGTEIANLIVVADVDFLSNRFAVTIQNLMGTKLVSPLNDNIAFGQNAVENLSGTNDLISLRSRGRFTRPFLRVQRMEAQAQVTSRMEEQRLQAELNAATQRLNELQQSGVGKQTLNDNFMSEIRDYRRTQSEARAKLRDLRRNLRQDIEGLGSWLFVLNTFFVPLLLIGLTVFLSFKRKRELNG